MISGFDRAPPGVSAAVVEAMLRAAPTDAFGQPMLTPAALLDMFEWVAAAQREVIAQVLEGMPDGVAANKCGTAVRRMRSEH